MGIHESCQRASGPARLGLRRLRFAAAGGLVLAALALSGPATANDANQAPDLKPNPWSLCAKATNLIERQEGIPRQLLRAISKVESGRFHKKKQLVMAWPWTVMAEGRGRYLPTKAAAIAEVESLKARGVKNIDVGCMQVNLYYHPHAFADLNQAFDPVANVAYAGSYLHQLRIEEGSWAKAVARYHSANPSRYKQYRMKVHVAWRQERAKFLAALTEAQAAQFADLEPLPVIMTWHQATVAEPFHRQFDNLTFAAAPFETGIEPLQTGLEPLQAGPETLVSLTTDVPMPVSIAAREAPLWQLSVAIAAREPADPARPTMTELIAAREPADFISPLRQPVAIAAREPSEFVRPHVSIAAREPAEASRPTRLLVSIAAREPADPAAAATLSIPGHDYPGFARAEPVQPGEQWSQMWPLLQPHAERVGRHIFSLLQSLPADIDSNG